MSVTIIDPSARRRRSPRPMVVMASFLIGASAALVPVAGASASANSDRLNPNEQLNPGERLISPNGQYVLTMQGDGNLVEYAPGNRAVWATGTNRANSVVRMQGDGNLVVIAPGNVAVWSTGTNAAGSDVELQSDGNIVVYAPGHAARWASGAPGGSSSLADRIVTIARNEAGNSLHNHENGANCNYYSGAVGTGTPCAGGWRSEEWCADFARWVYGQAQARTTGLSPAAASFYSYGATNHTWKAGYSSANARVGDAVIYNLNSARTWASHVGIVTAVSGSSIAVTSGNNSANMVGTTGLFTPTSSSGISGYSSPVS